MKLREMMKVMKQNPNKINEIRIYFEKLNQEIYFSETTYRCDSLKSFLENTFFHAKGLGLWFKKLIINNTEIEVDYDYTFILYRKKYPSKVGIGTEMSTGRGGTYQWAEGNIVDCFFVDEIILNYNFGVRKNKYYKVKVKGYDYQHYPYSGRTHKKKYVFNDSCGLAPKINYTNVFKCFGITDLKNLKITIKRMNSVLSLEHQEIQRLNNCYSHDKYNDFCIYHKENKKLTIFIGNKDYRNNYTLFED
jgi:hypothetical protein